MNKINLFKMHSGELILANSSKNENTGNWILINPMEILMRRYVDNASSMILTPWLPFELITEEKVELAEESFLYVLSIEDKLAETYLKVRELYSEVIEDSKKAFNEKLDSVLRTEDLYSMASSMEEELESIQEDIDSLSKSKIKSFH